MKTATLRLSYDRAAGAFSVVGTPLLIEADESDFEGVREYLARRICDNPSIQCTLGTLGASVVRIVRARRG